MKVTQWFIGIPCYIGVYEIYSGDYQSYCYWNGFSWCFISESFCKALQFSILFEEYKYDNFGVNHPCKWLKWRGLADKP